MRTWIILGSALALAACGSAKTGTTVTCGDGTTLVGNTCEATGSGGSDGSGGSGGGDVTCGTGTHLDGMMCVPDGPGTTGAPTVTAIDPPDAGVTGYVLFTITGTGFAGADVTSLHVFFGDTTRPECEAQIGAATATTIAGEVPPACDLSVTVTVTTNFGSATIPFHYDALYAAEGDAGGVTGEAGELYVIDPFASLYGDLGPLTDAGGATYGLGGIAFDATGTLYGATTGDSPGDADEVSQLVTIDPGTAAVTVIGDLEDASETGYYVTNLKVSGGSLYGWAYWVVGEGQVIQGLVTIDPATATVTPVGTGGPVTFAEYYGMGGGLTVDGAGTIYAAANGAGADASWTGAEFPFDSTGELDTLDPTTGAATSVATLDWPIGAPVQALSYVGTTMVGVIDNGGYGAFLGQPIYGETLAVIDPTSTPIVSPAFELPAQIGAQSHVAALDMAPAGLTISRTLSKTHWQQLAPAGTVAAPAHR